MNFLSTLLLEPVCCKKPQKSPWPGTGLWNRGPLKILNGIKLILGDQRNHSELSNKHAANLILFEKIFPPTCLIRTYTFIYFQGKFLPTRLLEYLCLLILAEIPNYKIILSSFKLLFCCFKHFKEASKS